MYKVYNPNTGEMVDLFPGGMPLDPNEVLYLEQQLAAAREADDAEAFAAIEAVIAARPARGAA